jgi:D-amino-acid dehydrogenase
VRTTEGDVAASTVVICAGPWSRRLLRKLGADVPLDVERGYGIDVPDPGISLACPFVLEDHHVAFSPHRGGVRLSGRNELAGIATRPNYRLADNLMRSAKGLFPEMRTEGARPWMRLRPSTPDSLPVIDRAPRQRNVYLAFGHGHKGFGTGAITAQLVRELIDGAQPSVDVSPFGVSRFGLRRRSQPARGSAATAGR